MPFSQSIIEWPAELRHLLDGARIAPGHDGKSFCRVDVDVDSKTLLLLHEFESHVRHRPVRISLPDKAECVIGEMNPVLGLGGADDPSVHVGKVRISFHDLHENPGDSVGTGQGAAYARH